MNKSISRYWLLLGVTALAVAGLFSLVLVVARTPSLSELPLFAALFHKALVVHVDLSVLVWFLAIACLMWSLLAEGTRQVFPYLEESALITFALGMLAITASPLDPKGEALMSNYIPVITSPVFFLGLSLLTCGVLLMLVRMFTSRWSNRFSFSLQFAIFSGGLIALIAAAAFIWSYYRMAHDVSGQPYFEILFWGGGHVLQFLHAQMLIVCWLLLMTALSPHFQIIKLLLITLLVIGLTAALMTPVPYLRYDIDSGAYRIFFTNAMIMVGGVGPAILACFIVPELWKVRSRNALCSTLAMSVLLFLYGGVLGEMIEGQNVVIPAHYHGSIVGITLAFMGIAYYQLPQFGYRDVNSWKLAFWQPIVYGGGQLLHISGLAWSGGYGVLRKTPGGMDALSPDVKATMGLMGLGGLIAIIGGFMFVIVIWQAVRKPKP